VRYILDDLGFVEEVSFGGIIECNNKTCTEYTGEVPEGYDSLIDWFEKANIRAYKIEDGNLVYNEFRALELETEWALQNGKVSTYTLKGLTINVTKNGRIAQLTIKDQTNTEFPVATFQDVQLDPIYAPAVETNFYGVTYLGKIVMYRITTSALLRIYPNEKPLVVNEVIRENTTYITKN